ncbi:MAG TPA: hypothetical protein VG722_09510 [Tepidisphaeraceae bacterium]|nr:hypothetical protein [Tepidisphaeraceae bacterium]
MTTTWEAFRLTSKSPGELLTTLGPQAVDHLIRQALDALWREYPTETRSYLNVRKRAQEVYARNMKVWNAIKKPTPAAFFDHLLPYTADGLIRQALVMTWMMMPRQGGRDFSRTRKIFQHIFDRNMAAWEEDNRTFSSAPAKKRPAKKITKKPARKKTKKQK